MLHSKIKFAVFSHENFEATDKKMVVTKADMQQRIVYEINAEPAAEEYARLTGLSEHSLTPFSFASHPVAVKVGEQHFCRSIQKVNPDNSLTFYCAIDEGIVLHCAQQPANIADKLGKNLTVIADNLAGIGFILGFDCILNRSDIQNSNQVQEIDYIFNFYNIVAFHTYGEQFNGMHLNQTFTGIAFAAER